MAVNAPPRVRARLRAAPDGPVPVLHRGAHAVYVEVSGWCVGVVDRHACQVPCALAGRDLDLVTLGAGAAYVLGGDLHLAGVRLVIGRLRGVGVPRVGRSRLRDALPAGSRPTPLDAGKVVRLVGAGDGLTPRGDDVLCGWLALCRAVGRPTPVVDEAVRARSGHTTMLSATLLDCAAHGEVVPELAGYLAALGTPAQVAAEADLLAVGHSSGSGLLEGARLAAAEVLSAESAAA